MTSIRAEDLRTDPEEVAEWVESFDQLVAVGGRHRAASVLHALAQRAAAAGVSAETAIATDYVNTIPVADEPPFAGDEDLERRFRRLIRWNAAVLVHRAQRADIGVGGHISTYAGAATLYEVGLNHFFRGPDHPGGGD
jgi:pyruvate dehydrogenase E1 component